MCCTQDLLHKGSTWCWTSEHSQAVDAIKEALTSSTTLSHYDPKLPLSIACDAIQVGIGAVLFHTLPDKVEKPVAYPSRKLSKAVRKSKKRHLPLSMEYRNSDNIC